MCVICRRARPAAPDQLQTAEALLTLLEGQLVEERATKTNLESRAMGVITSSGTIVALLLALSSLVSERDDFTLPIQARWLLMAAMLGFLVAIVAAVLVARPRVYHEVSDEGLLDMASDKRLSLAPTEAKRHVANAVAKITVSARVGNGKKAKSLKVAIAAEVLSIALVGLAVGVVLAVG